MIRKLIATAALAGLFLVSGCNESGSGENTSSGGGASTASTPTSAPPSVADNTKKVCADMEALNAEFKQKLVALLTRAVQEGVAGDEAKAEKTLEELKVVLPEFGGKVEALAASASNTELKQALTTFGSELRKANEDTFEDVVTAAENKYKAICNK
jgi:hypothetical protein